MKRKFTDIFPRRAQQALFGTKVLVCRSGAEFRESFETDRNVYLRHYKTVDEAVFTSIGNFLTSIEAGYDIVHLFCRLSPEGSLLDNCNGILSGTELISRCSDQKVKLLWIANENKADSYIKGFKAAGRSLNVVMNISRPGTVFSEFLEKLLSRVSQGEMLPKAWAALVPQAPGPWHRELPVCIFYAGNPNVKLLS